MKPRSKLSISRTERERNPRDWEGDCADFKNEKGLGFDRGLKTNSSLSLVACCQAVTSSVR